MKFVPAAITKVVARQALLTEANAPKVLFGAGVVGSVASTVLACRATLKLDEVLDKTREDLHVAKSIEHADYSESDRKHDTAIIYARSVVGISRLYAPAVLVGAVSIGCLTKSHNMLQDRTLALTAAYAAIDKAYTGYREQVIEKFGEEEDRALAQQAAKVELAGFDAGTDQAVPRQIKDHEHSIYARFFDEYSPSWSKEPEYNLIFLKCQQNWANDLLKARGHIFLNEVYDSLGLQRSRAGAVVGWILSDDSDNYVDFGLFGQDGEARDFVNGREGAVLLDFNVDGVIFDKIREHGERLRWQS